MSTSPPAPHSTAEPQLCPLDGASTSPAHSGYLACSRCLELLAPDEAVSRATHETWALYLLFKSTDTRIRDAPIQRLSRSA